MPSPPPTEGRFELKACQEALAASRKREADLKKANEVLRARVESFLGLRSLTEATEETNTTLRAEAVARARRCREDREGWDITKGALEKSRADAARVVAELAQANAARSTVERSTNAAEAQTRAALTEAARVSQRRQETAQALGLVTGERDLALTATRALERDQRESEATIEALEARLVDAETRADEAEASAADARDRAWRHHRSAAETKSLAVDVRRLVQLLASTDEYRRFGELWRDGGGCSYVGPEAAEPFDACADFAPAPTQRDWAAFAELERKTEHEEVLLDASDEFAKWAPTEALKTALAFHQTHVPHVPFDLVREFLHRTNGAWLQREQKHCDRLEQAYRRRLDELQRVTQHGIPYEKLAQDKEIAKLKAELKRVRKGRLKGRPRSATPRSSLKTMRSSARDELLAASLSAMECMSMASGSPSKRTPTSKGTPSPLTSRGSRSSRRGNY